MKPLLHLLTIAVFGLGLSAAVTFAQDGAQASAQDAATKAARLDADREKAFALVEQNNFKEALPLLEKVYAAKPDDVKVIPRLAIALVAMAGVNPDQSAALVQLKRARQLAEKAQKLGNDSELMKTLLARIPAEGDAPTGEKRQRTPAEDAMSEAENAFTSGDMEKALAGYARAEKLDPKLYEAPLYAGDAYFKLEKITEAGQAYARAIAIDPDRDTAYRFWGNVLMQSGKLDAAREKFIEAVIAEPYGRAPWEFLSRWAKAKQLELSHPRIDIPTSSVKRKDDKNIDITAMLSGKEDGTAAWMGYSISKAAWMTDDKEFKKAYPQETQYRHSLQEEISGLRLALELVTNQLKEKKLKEKDLDVSLANLLKLQRANLIEPFILFAKVDDGIAQDYAAYRQANRDKLRQYLMEFVAPNK